MSNPAAVYCTGLGYDYTVVKGSTGEYGVCQFPDKSQCEEWQFLSGKCGQSYSYCAKQGYGTKTLSDGKNSFSKEYATCTSSDGKTVGAVSDLYDLKAKTIKGTGEVPPEGAGASAPADKSLPTSFDWRNRDGKNWMTSVKDQGICGACWAFSAAGTTEPILKLSQNDPGANIDLSEEYMISDCHSYLGYQTCCGGWNNIALKFIRDSGIPDEACMPYVDGLATGCSCAGGTCSSICKYNTGSLCSDKACSDRCSDWQSRTKQLDAYGPVSSSQATIKQAIIEKGPLAVSMKYDGYWDGDIFRCANDTGINHAVVLVGYNDAGGYWIIKNSWGSTWNGDGYFKLGYGECSLEGTVFYAAKCRKPKTVCDSNSTCCSGNCSAGICTSKCGDGICWNENSTSCPQDCNFTCGDADNDGHVMITDAVFLISYIFGGGPAPNPLAAGDVDSDGVIQISDVVYIINYIFNYGSPPCQSTTSWDPSLYSSWTQQQVLAYMTNSSCGDGVCNATLGENCSTCPEDCGNCTFCGDGICNGNENCTTCPSDCGSCPNCTPRWYCSNGRTRAFVDQNCRVSYYPCSSYFCCKNGACYKDISNKCLDYAAAEMTAVNAAQVQGVDLRTNFAFALAMVTLIGLVVYSFIKTETKLN